MRRKMSGFKPKKGKKKRRSKRKRMLKPGRGGYRA